MRIKILLLFITYTTILKADPIAESNTKKDSIVIANLLKYTLVKSQCYYDLEYLCKKIGHRLSGSDACAKAVVWGKKTLLAAGCDTVYVQPVMVPHWIRGIENATVFLNNKKQISLHPLGLGNSEGTSGKNLIGNVIMVENKEELEKLGEAKIKGKIVFFNHEWDQSKPNPFNEYGGCVFYRWAGPSLAAKYGAIASITRSAGSAYDNYAHTGSMRYDEKYARIPALAISYAEAEILEKEIKNIKQITINSTSHFKPDVLSYNVIGELKGTTYPGEIVTVGGHLDSWDVGEGAHDDGAGVVQSIEVIRSLKKQGVQPKRTIRCVLFMNEENGLRGGKEYARLAKENKENHICAIETDAGGFSPRGFSLTGTLEQRATVKSWLPLFMPLGVYDFEEEGGGADIGPLRDALNVPVMELTPDPQRYFDIHHTANDVFEQVNRRELSLGAVALTTMAYLISEYGL